jgi:chromosome segregation ATPase
MTIQEAAGTHHEQQVVTNSRIPRTSYSRSQLITNNNPRIMASEVAARMANTQLVANQDVANFFELLRALATNSSTTWIDQVLKDNEKMKANVKEKEDDHNSLVRVITKLRNELDTEAAKSKEAISQSEAAKAKADELATEIEGAKKTIADKDQRLQEDVSTITTLRGSVEALDKEVRSRDDIIKKHEEQQANDGTRIKELEGSLSTTKAELNVRLNQLEEIQSLSCKVVDRSKEDV